MRKLLLTITLLATLIMIETKLFANENNDNNSISSYASGRLIFNAMKADGADDKVSHMDATTPQFGIGAAVGIAQKINYIVLRYEVDYSFTMRKNSYYHAMMLNLYLQVEAPRAPIYPYIMAGVGFNTLDPTFAYIETQFAFNFGGGVLVPISENGFLLDISVRYMQANFNFHINDGRTIMQNNIFYVGMMKKF